MSSTVSQLHWPSEEKDRLARFASRGVTMPSPSASARSSIARISYVSAPSGSWKISTPPTCIGCSRDSPRRNIESRGDMGSGICGPFHPVDVFPDRGKVRLWSEVTGDGEVPFVRDHHRITIRYGTGHE